MSLTTSHTADEFAKDYSLKARWIERTASSISSNIARGLRLSASRGAYGGRDSDLSVLCYSREAVHLLTLKTLSDSIVESEGVVEEMAGETGEDYVHACGELFALKSVYISIVLRYRDFISELIRSMHDGANDQQAISFVTSKYLPDVEYLSGDSYGTLSGNMVMHPQSLSTIISPSAYPNISFKGF